jgi:hypothetical protein
MYGNTPFGDEASGVELTADQRRVLRRDLTSIAARTRELLPSEFVVGSEITEGNDGPRATVAVRPPVGSPVSADYTPADGAGATIEQGEQEDLATGLAASAALQMKQAMPENPSPTAQ